MNKRIIVIDDQQNILDDFKTILQPEESDLKKEIFDLASAIFEEENDIHNYIPNEKYDITTALQGEEGYRLIEESIIQKRPFAAAFIDMRMPPGWDGLKTAAKIREIDPNIEIVIVTAYSDQKRIDIVKEVGHPDKLLYLKKPFAKEEIRQLALALTEKWNLEHKNSLYLQNLEKMLQNISQVKGLSSGGVTQVLNEVLQQLLDFINANNGVLLSINREKWEFKILAMKGDYISDDIALLINDVPENQLFSDEYFEHEKHTFMPIGKFMPSTGKKLKNDYIIAILKTSVDPEISMLMKLFINNVYEVIKNAKMYEEQLKHERYSVLGLAAGTILHDLKNPISIIKGYANLFEEKYGKQFLDIETYFKPINRALGNIEEIISDVLNFASHKINLDKERVDVTKIINEVLESNKIIFQANKINIVTVFKDEPLIASVDRIKMKRVFNNILSNSVAAVIPNVEHKSIKIIVHKDNDKCKIRFEDNGIGISERNRPHIFEPFYSSGKKSGTGLGMAIAKRVIEAHDGEIDFKSEENKGTVFFIEIPI